jgi:L-asparaginase
MQKVLWLATGGTIAMKKNPHSGALEPAQSAQDLLELVPELQKIAQIDLINVANIDSTNIQARHWISLVEHIEAQYDRYDGFVITHGTDTMAFSASALSFMIQDLGKPIVFTGAQLPLTDPITDARQNLTQSFRFATENIGEVVICFGSKLLRGNRSQKKSEFSFKAFASLNVPCLGEMGLRPKIREHCQSRDNTKKPRFIKTLEEKVFVLHLFPGIDPQIIDTLSQSGIRGIVINAFGAGNIPNHAARSFTPAIQKAIRNGVTIVVTSQCDFGAAEMFLYETGFEAHKNASVSGGDMTVEAALTKLMMVLSHTKNPQEIKTILQTNLAGELTEDLL